jgi:hypothetical protein
MNRKASISFPISKESALALVALYFFLSPSQGFAQPIPPPSAPPGAAPTEPKKAPSSKNSGDLDASPWAGYGEFNEEEEEIADTRFFQTGRFFGVSLGGGMAGALGNRGLLWQGGFPSIDLKVHYWFDFNLALDLGFNQSSFFYEILSRGERVDIKQSSFGASVKYYIPTQNLSSAIGFASPYLVLGIASYTKQDFSQKTEATTEDSQAGVNAGAGLEFVISHRKTYLTVEGRLHSIPYLDSNSTDFATTNAIDDLAGLHWNTSVSILFTW